MLGLTPPLRRGWPCRWTLAATYGGFHGTGARHRRNADAARSGASAAQMSNLDGTPAPGAGMTSSLGTIDLTSPIGGSGIPLGSSELFAGGLSPAPIGPIDSTTTCPNMTMSGALPASPSPASPSNTFDGGGVTSNAINPATSTGCGTAGTGFPVLSGLSSVPGSAAVTPTAATSLASIQLGGTDLGSAGLSGPIGVPVPSPSTTACPGAGGILTGIIPGLGSGSPTAGTAALPGVSLPFGC
jgi:hypothetical protein